MVVSLYYYEELTMKEIGLTLGVVESRVSQIHSSAVVRLRAALAGLKADNSGSTGKKKVNGRMVSYAPGYTVLGAVWYFVSKVSLIKGLSIEGDRDTLLSC